MQQHGIDNSSSLGPPQQQPDQASPGVLRIAPPQDNSIACDLPVGAPSPLQFRLPVDVEHKAVVLRLLGVSRPHMMAFHLSWVCLFVTFTATFAPAALLPVLQVGHCWHTGCLWVCVGREGRWVGGGKMVGMVGQGAAAAVHPVVNPAAT